MALYRESFVFVVHTDPLAIFWTGHGDLLLPDDDVLPEAVIVPGAGELISLPDLEGLINGRAQRVEITFSGVSDDTLRLAVEEAATIAGTPCDIGRVEFDEEWQVAGPVTWEWSGEAQKLSVSSEASDEGRTRSVVFVAAAGDITRTRAPLAFFTDSAQRRDFPDDGFFSHVGRINAGTSRRWGVK